MNVAMRDQTIDWSQQKFGIGQPVPRTEDPTLVQGQGRYTDDLDLPGQAYGVMVRSRNTHGIIRGIVTEAARLVNPPPGQKR
jgi:carbon-monoxide dehydrogenase large subunit